MAEFPRCCWEGPEQLRMHKEAKAWYASNRQSLAEGDRFAFLDHVKHLHATKSTNYPSAHIIGKAAVKSGDWIYLPLLTILFGWERIKESRAVASIQKAYPKLDRSVLDASVAMQHQKVVTDLTVPTPSDERTSAYFVALENGVHDPQTGKSGGKVNEGETKNKFAKDMPNKAKLQENDPVDDQPKEESPKESLPQKAAGTTLNAANALSNSRSAPTTERPLRGLNQQQLAGEGATTANPKKRKSYVDKKSYVDMTINDIMNEFEPSRTDRLLSGDARPEKKRKTQFSVPERLLSELEQVCTESHTLRASMTADAAIFLGEMVATKKKLDSYIVRVYKDMKRGEEDSEQFEALNARARQLIAEARSHTQEESSSLLGST